MQIKQSTFKIKGMRRDDSYSSFNPEYSWSNKNIRLTARDGNDLLSITNERGNTPISFFSDVTYNYQLLFSGYSDVLELPTYNYTLSFSEYQDVLEPPIYNYQLKFSSYSDTLIESI